MAMSPALAEIARWNETSQYINAFHRCKKKEQLLCFRKCTATCMAAHSPKDRQHVRLAHFSVSLVVLFGYKIRNITSDITSLRVPNDYSLSSYCCGILTFCHTIWQWITCFDFPFDQCVLSSCFLRTQSCTGLLFLRQLTLKYWSGLFGFWK